MKKSIKTGIFLAILAAALYALNAPFSKLLLDFMPTTLMAGFLYIGAGLGMAVIALIRRAKGASGKEKPLTKRELPYTVAMILLDIAAPICLLAGLASTSAASVSLLGNFEIVATAVIALMIFKEKISKRLWLGILFVTASCALLSLDNIANLQFSFGALFVLLACICWGFENNCTRKISSKDPLQIVLLKGIFSGIGSVIVGLCIGERITAPWSVFAVLGVGFVAYGLSIFFYVYAQRILGAARTSAYYAIAPFIGTLLSLVIFRELPAYTYFIALFLMVLGAWLCAVDEPLFKKKRITPRKKAPFVDVYFAKLPDTPPTSPVLCAARQAEIEGTANERLRREKHYVWRLLCYGLEKSLGLCEADLTFTKEEHGAWTVNGAEFSLSHSKNLLAVAVSLSPVGIDAECVAPHRKEIADKLFTEAEREALDALPADLQERFFITTFTGKEALYKQAKGALPLSLLDTTATPLKTGELTVAGNTYLWTLATDTPHAVRIFDLTEKNEPIL